MALSVFHVRKLHILEMVVASGLIDADIVIIGKPFKVAFIKLGKVKQKYILFVTVLAEGIGDDRYHCVRKTEGLLELNVVPNQLNGIFAICVCKQLGKVATEGVIYGVPLILRSAEGCKVEFKDSVVFTSHIDDQLVVRYFIAATLIQERNLFSSAGNNDVAESGDLFLPAIVLQYVHIVDHNTAKRLVLGNNYA